jgi:hypothetical protein
MLKVLKKRRAHCFVTFFSANFELFRKFNLKSIHIFTLKSRSVERRKKEKKKERKKERKERQKGKIFYEER